MLAFVQYKRRRRSEKVPCEERVMEWMCVYEYVCDFADCGGCCGEGEEV